MVADTNPEAGDGIAELGADGNVLISMKILPLLKERQQQHGLRHGDFQRYHGYCSRRLRRLRETLKIPQGDRRHFKKKEITVIEIDSEKADSRHLEIPLTVTERAWACAMALKQDANTETRKKFHMISRLKKAVKYAENLVSLAEESTRIDPRTKLECEAYASFINAAYYFEKEQWKDAMVAYKKTQSIYTQISQALGDQHPEGAVYAEKTAEILPAMRFCSYKSGGELKISDLASEYQSAAIEAMIAQRPKMSEVTFRSTKITVSSEKIAAVLVRIEEFEKKVDRKIEMYEQILIELRDAIQTIRDSAKIEQPPTAKTKPSLLLSYLIYLRLRLTNSRTELMMQDKPLPKDKIRFVEMIVHNFVEMKTIPGLETDEDFQQEIDDQTTLFQGIRSRYIGDVYKYNKRWAEALAVYQRSADYVKRAMKGLSPSSVFLELAKTTAIYCEAVIIECRAQILIQQKLEEDGVEENLFKYSRPEKPLCERLDEYVLDESLISKKPNVMTVPPPMRAIPCKPLFFDLAGNHISYPMAEIEENAGTSKKSPKKDGAAGGISGLVKGLWGWGGK